MNKKVLRVLMSIILVVSMLGVLIGCTSNQPNQDQVDGTEVTQNEGYRASIVDSTGETITLTKKPERIVSLAPSTTEILYFLGVEDAIVGRTDYCTFPETIETVQSVGSTSEPNIEAIVELAPDLVVASTHVSEEVITKLREVGIAIAFLNEQESFEGTYSAIEQIGILIGEEEEASKVIADMKQKVEETSKKVAELTEGRDLPKVYYTMGFGEGDYTAGGDTFIGEIITLAGGKNIADEISGWSISKEQILEGDPDIIIVPSGRNMIEDLSEADFYKDLRAVKEGQVYEINEDMISRQGPRVVDAYVEIAKIIHPELD